MALYSRRAGIALLFSAVAAGVAHGQNLSPGALCAAAARAGERNADVPAGLLLAIGVVESGRADTMDGATRPWPWTLDIAGAAHFYASQAAALAALRAAEAAGARSIDVGCFQVNLAQHPDAFVSDEQALDPAANGNYAGRLLGSLHAAAGDWAVAVAHYHSLQAALGTPYSAQVIALWTGSPAAVRAAAVNDPFVVRVASAVRAAHLPVVWGERAITDPCGARHGLPRIITPSGV